MALPTVKKQPPTATTPTGVALFDETCASQQQPSPSSYPPVSSLPRTPNERLALATEDAITNGVSTSRTILYLAYGSNMSAHTFLGVRGVRPLSKINVSAPTLRLTFNLPGLPYLEPCFANVGMRKLPEKPDLPNPIHPPILPPFEPPGSDDDEEWKSGLVGVVYEITPEDWRNIIRTEGAGLSYKEIVVPCIPLSPDVSIPEKEPLPSIPRPFLATTLYAPRLPVDKPPGKKNWIYRLTSLPHRPDPDYSQPSPRYLKLLTDGAREHDMPLAYRDHLATLQPYVASTLRQRIGRVLLIMFWAPVMLFWIAATWVLSDKRGRAPMWLQTFLAVSFNLMWMLYDHLFKPVFGDGERTQEKCDDAEKNKHLVNDAGSAREMDLENAPLLAA